MIMTISKNVQAVRVAVSAISDAIESIHAPFVHAIIAATGEQSEQELTDIINALKTDKCVWLHEQGKQFALACVDGAVWEGGKIKLAHDADELTLNPCADIRGATKWWVKVAAPKGKQVVSLVAKLSTFCKFLDGASKQGGVKLVAGETREQAGKAAQAMAMIASGAVSFDDIITLGTLPVADDTAPSADVVELKVA